MSGSRLYLILGAVAALIVLGLVAYTRSQTVPAVPTPLPTTEEVTPSPEATASSQLIIDLEEQNESSESGTAKLVEVDGKVMVTLEIEGAPANVAQPAHIHVGACPKPGAVKYPLQNVVDGASETTVDVPMADLLAQLPLAINVHKSQAQSGVYVACGDIVAP